MKHLRIAVSVVITSLVAAGIGSCSSAPPPPDSARTARGVTVGYGIRASCIPAPVAERSAALTGATDPRQRMTLALQLPLRDQAQLTQLLNDLYNPTSRRFHQFLSVSQFTERFGPTAADYDNVVKWAKSRGLEVTVKTPNRRLVAVEAPVQTINRAFQVRISNYRHPSENRIFFSADREPAPVGLSVPLLQITGLSNYVLPHPMLRRGKPASFTGSGSGPSGEYLPSDLRAAYYGNGPLTGAGQTIGILSFDGYLASDVQLYYSKTGMSSKVPIKNVLVGGFNGACTSPGSTTTSTCDDGEQVLDIVNAIGMAPGIKQILFYEGAHDTRFSTRWPPTTPPRC
jgi:subtilase family serine protease